MTTPKNNKGNTGAPAPVAYETLSHEELVAVIASKSTELEELQKKIEELNSELEIASKTNEELSEANEFLSEANQKKTTVFSIGKEKFTLKIKSFWFKYNGTMTKVTEKALLEDKSLLAAVHKRGDYLIPIK
jgi:TolA-binding protein